MTYLLDPPEGSRLDDFEHYYEVTCPCRQTTADEPGYRACEDCGDILPLNEPGADPLADLALADPATVPV